MNRRAKIVCTLGPATATAPRLAELIDAGTLTTMGGDTHSFSPADGGFLIDNQVRVDDSLAYPTENGMVYLVDSVLVPDNFVAQYCEVG